MFLYATPDVVGLPDHGGGTITYHESEALKSLGPCEVWGRDVLGQAPATVCTSAGLVASRWLFRDVLGQATATVWDHDETACRKLRAGAGPFRLCQTYSTPFPGLVPALQSSGCKVVCSVAAHRVADSKKAHEDLGLAFNYPHLTDPELWKHYSSQYMESDVVVVPSKHSARAVREQGRTGRVEVIPRGCVLPEKVAPLPRRFTVGYLGVCGGPDKGLRYLLEAWKKLNYPDATLALAGGDSNSPWVQHLIRTYGGGNVEVRGWVKDAGDFYNSISLYVQPSVSEGWGLEVSEAMSYARPVLCSDGAGAADFVEPADVFPAGDAGALAKLIDAARSVPPADAARRGEANRRFVADYTWGKIRARYVALWKEMLG